MILPSNLLSVFSFHNGQQRPEDGVLNVPNDLQPTIEIPEQILNLADVTVDQTSLAQTSFHVSSLLTNTNAVGVTRVLGTLAPGVWELTILVQFISNWAAGVATAQFGLTIFDSAGGFSTNLARFFALNATNSFQENVKFRFAHSLRTGFQIRAATGTTGVGQTNTASVALLANRLG